MIKDVVNTYLWQSICLIAAMSLLFLLYINLWGDKEQMTVSVCISAVFQLVACIIYAFVWRWVRSSSPNSLPTLYMAASAFRMFAAVVTVMLFCFMNASQNSILSFVVIFLIYYFVVLIFDTWYFVKIEKKNKQTV